ncbi:hypothetical protein KDW_59620 [Dictyobacter vulcani]|uniref:Uncharacterized protein n=1 Tax=Dictyobacter vulcani TaxID=2607529 RepID=A0A5J4KZ33_9CHLR|nr:hypothetical protein KDW_59620 [Dictyobacter vulcani]
MFRVNRATRTREVHGATAVAKQFSGRAREAQVALIDGAIGAVVAPLGHLGLVFKITITHNKIAEINVIIDPEQLSQLELAILEE